MAAGGYAVVMSALICLCFPSMISDVTFRYAPMADAFARGEWSLAFHPRFGVLFQCLTGTLVYLTGLRGDWACQTIATLLLSLSAIPLWLIARRLFGEKVAWWTVVAYLLCPEFLYWAMHGLRDTGKCLAFALIGLGVVENRSRWLGLGVFILVSLVSYGFALGTAFVFGWCVYALWRRQWAQIVWPLVGWALGVAAVTIMVHAFTGHWVPAPHFIRYVGGWL